MMKKVLFLLMFMPALAFSGMPRGERMERQLWKDRKNQKIEKIKSYTSKEFQSIGFFTTPSIPAQNRFDILSGYKEYLLQNYQLSQIKTTSGKNSIVVTYKASFTIKIEGENGEPSPLAANCLSVWKKYGNEWKWISHTESLQDL